MDLKLTVAGIILVVLNFTSCNLILIIDNQDSKDFYRVILVALEPGLTEVQSSTHL